MMRRSSIHQRAFAALGLALTVSALACSILVSTEDLSGPSDAAVDAPDVSLPVDAATDSPSDAGGGDACKATFCESFDDGEVGSRWTSKRVVGDATLTHDTSGFRSPPNALRARVDTDGSVAAAATLERNLGPGRAISCSFDWLIAKRPSRGLSDVIVLRTAGTDVNSYEVLFGLGESGKAALREDQIFTDGGCGCPASITSPVSPGADWVRVTIETDFTRVVLRYDGLVVEERPLVGVKQSGDIYVKIGASGYVISPFDFRIDNLECTVTP